MSSNPLVLTPIEGGPRIHDLALAERLEFSQALDIRKLIKRNEVKLLNFGILATVAKIHEGAGRPTAEYFLNQKQAIFVCMKSETDKAFDVQVEIVRVFDAYLNKTLVAPHAAPAPVYISSGQESQMSNRILNLARPFYMEGSVKHWLFKYANALAGVHRRQFIPASQFPEVLAMLNSIEAQVDVYRDERIRHEKDWLLLTLKRELDKRLGRAGPEFEMLAAPAADLIP